MGHVISGQDLEEELGSGRCHIDDFLWSGVPEHVQEDLMMDPGQVKHADCCGDGAAAELIPAGQCGLLASGQVPQEGRSVIAGPCLAANISSTPAGSRPAVGSSSSRTQGRIATAPGTASDDAQVALLDPGVGQQV